MLCSLKHGNIIWNQQIRSDVSILLCKCHLKMNSIQIIFKEKFCYQFDSKVDLPQTSDFIEIFLLTGMSWCDICVLPWLPSLPVVPPDEFSEVSPGDSERCDFGDCPAAHSSDHHPLLSGATVRHQTGGGRDTLWSHSVFLLVPPPDVHLPSLPQTLSQHQRTQAYDCCLDALSPRQHRPGQAPSVQLKSRN